MGEVSPLRRFGNRLFRHAFPVYEPLYRVYKAYSDRTERALIKRLLRPGAVVVDGGANIGAYTRFAARLVGPNGLVHAFEPAPDNYEHLARATRRLHNVRANRKALGESSGTSQLYISKELNVDHRAYAIDEAREAVPLEIVALDDYFGPGERVDLLKLDVQGYELHALRGAARVLSDNPQINVLVELWPHGLREAGGDWRELVDLLRSFAMEVMLVDADGVTDFDERKVQDGFSCYLNVFAARDVAKVLNDTASSR